MLNAAQVESAQVIFLSDQVFLACASSFSPFFHHLPQEVLMYRKMVPIGEVRGFWWFHPEREVGQTRQNLPTKTSGLFIKKGA